MTEQEETVQTQDEQTEAPQAVPETDEAVEKLKALIADDPEILKKVENLHEFEKRVNKKSMEAAELRKQAESLLKQAQSAPKTEASSDDDIELDDRAQAVLRKFLEKELAPVFSTIAEERKESEQAIWGDFTESHGDVPADLVVDKFYELGLDKTANTPQKYKRALETAYKAAKAENIDAIIAERIEQELSKVKASGDEVVAVKEKRSAIAPTPESANDIINNPDIPWYEQFRRIGS